MSRSKRKSPFRGVTTAESEKADKVASHRTLRRVAKKLISSSPDTPLLPEDKLVNPWSMDKDGKMRFDPVAEPKLMRK